MSEFIFLSIPFFLGCLTTRLVLTGMPIGSKADILVNIYRARAAIKRQKYLEADKKLEKVIDILL